MRCFLYTLTLGITAWGGVTNAGDFPFEAIVLSDGVLMIDKHNGQSWIIEAGAPRPPGMPPTWKHLPLPGVSNGNMPPNHSAGPRKPGQNPQGSIAPGHFSPGHFSPGPVGPSHNPQAGMHPDFGPMMSPQMPNIVPMQPGMPGWPGSNGMPKMALQVPLSVPPSLHFPSPGSPSPSSPPPYSTPQPNSSELPAFFPSGSYSNAVPNPETVAPPEPFNDNSPASSPQHIVAPETPTESHSVADQTTSNSGNPPVLIVVSDAEIDLDEVVLLRLAFPATFAQSAPANVSVEFPADGKLVRGGNPSSISDDVKDSANRVTMSHAGDKPLELVFRFSKPGKKPLTVSVETLGQVTSVTVNVMVKEDDDENHPEDEKKSPPDSKRKHDIRKKK